VVDFADTHLFLYFNLEYVKGIVCLRAVLNGLSAWPSELGPNARQFSFSSEHTDAFERMAALLLRAGYVSGDSLYYTQVAVSIPETLRVSD